MMQEAYPVVLPGKFLHDRECLIAGAVVHEDDFVQKIGMVQHFQHRADVTRLVIGWQDGRDVWSWFWFEHKVSLSREISLTYTYDSRPMAMGEVSYICNFQVN
jgi:hypothetical protein